MFCRGRLLFNHRKCTDFISRKKIFHARKIRNGSPLLIWVEELIRWFLGEELPRSLGWRLGSWLDDHLMIDLWVEDQDHWQQSHDGRRTSMWAAASICGLKDRDHDQMIRGWCHTPPRATASIFGSKIGITVRRSKEGVVLPYKRRHLSLGWRFGSRTDDQEIRFSPYNHWSSEVVCRRWLALWVIGSW